MNLKILKKNLLIALTIFLLFLGIEGTVYAVEFFIDSEKPNNGKIIMFFNCDNNRMVKIIHLGGNRYQFY